MILDKLLKSEKYSNDRKEIIYDEIIRNIKDLKSDFLIEAIDESILLKPNRKKYQVYILCEFTQIDQVIERIIGLIHDPDTNTRAHIIQTISQHKIYNLAFCLNSIMEQDDSEFCRTQAIHASGILLNDINFPIIMGLTKTKSQSKSLKFSLIIAISRYSRPESIPYLKRMFRNWFEDKSIRINSAWGLGKLGDKRAINYLIKMMYDPDKRTQDSYEPGESFRASQAICDIFNLDFKWDKEFILKNRDTWKGVAKK